MDSKARKREEIATAAQALFAEYGFKSVSIDQIAQRAQVGKGTFYLYFKDKEDVLQEMMLRHLRALEQEVRGIEARHLPLLDEIHQSMLACLAFRVNQRLPYKLAQEARELQTPSAVRAIQQMEEAIEHHLRLRLDRALEQGLLRATNTELLAFLIHAVYKAVAFDWEERHGKLDDRQLAEAAMAVLQHGLLRNPENPPAGEPAVGNQVF